MATKGTGWGPPIFPARRCGVGYGRYSAGHVLVISRVTCASASSSVMPKAGSEKGSSTLRYGTPALAEAAA
ncbi:hypothetical protein [Nocardia beijingensis]